MAFFVSSKFREKMTSKNHGNCPSVLFICLSSLGVEHLSSRTPAKSETPRLAFGEPTKGEGKPRQSPQQSPGIVCKRGEAE